MRRASIYGLLGLAMAGLVAIGLTVWSTAEDGEAISAREEARAAAERWVTRFGGAIIEKPKCTIDRHASDREKFTFDCVYTEAPYFFVPIPPEVPYERAREVRIQGTRGPTGEFVVVPCKPMDIQSEIREFYLAFADC